MDREHSGPIGPGLGSSSGLWLRYRCGRSPSPTLFERNQSKRALTRNVRSGFLFHPTDQDLSVGTPEKEKATWLSAARVDLLWFRCKTYCAPERYNSMQTHSPGAKAELVYAPVSSVVGRSLSAPGNRMKSRRGATIRFAPPLQGWAPLFGRLPRSASAAADFTWAMFRASLRDEELRQVGQVAKANLLCQHVMFMQLL